MATAVQAVLAAYLPTPHPWLRFIRLWLRNGTASETIALRQIYGPGRIIGLGGVAAFVNIDGSRGSVDAPGEVDVRPVPVGSLPLAALSQIYFQTSPRSGIQPRMTAVPRTYGQAACTGHGGCAVLAETNGAARWARVRIVVAETNVPDARGARRFRWSNPTRRL